MIRAAEKKDISSIVEMTERLRASTQLPIEIDPAATARFVGGLLASPLAWVRVVDGPNGPTGFLAASVGTAAVSMVPIAVEHGWWAEQGGGSLLLRGYMAWAKSIGCFAVRMSTPPHNEIAAQILHRLGFQLAEQAWVKVI